MNYQIKIALAPMRTNADMHIVQMALLAGIFYRIKSYPELKE